MQYAKRIFLISDFKNASPKSIRVERRRWPKGLIRLGHDVQVFSYRDMMKQCSLFPGKFVRKHFGKVKANEILLEQIRKYHPDIVLIICLKDFDPEMITKMRDASEKAVFVGRDCDAYPEKNPARLKSAKGLDIFVATNAGRFLQTYKNLGIPICAFIPCPCDPDIQRKYEDLDKKWKCDIIFMGTEEHSRLGMDMERYNLLTALSKIPRVKMYGCFGRETVDGVEAFYAINGAKIALSINTPNDVRLYHSDRLVNCLSCGTFTLAKRVPDTELLFKDGVHLKYFDTAEEFFELADWYLKHDQEREKIAKAGMERAHSEFNCVKMAKYLMDLIETGTYDAPWATIL
jgi:spore maturation protein CgeB